MAVPEPELQPNGSVEEVGLAPAGFRDLAEVRRMYRAQPPESRRFFHPLPFGRFQLTVVLLAIVLLQYRVRFWVRLAPSLGILLWLARDPATGLLVGMGNARFYRDRSGTLVARTGLYVRPDSRRSGVGLRIGATMLDQALRLGAGRAEALILPPNVASRRMHEVLGYDLRPTVYRDRHSSDTEWLIGVIDLAEWNLSRPSKVSAPAAVGAPTAASAPSSNPSTPGG